MIRGEHGSVTSLDILNGKQGWEKVRDGEAVESDSGRKRLLYGRIRDIEESRLFRFNVKPLRLSKIPDLTVNGRPAALGIQVSCDDRLELYFDKESHLLLKFVRHEKSEVGEEFTTMRWFTLTIEKSKASGSPIELNGIPARRKSTTCRLSR